MGDMELSSGERLDRIEEKAAQNDRTTLVAVRVAIAASVIAVVAVCSTLFATSALVTRNRAVEQLTVQGQSQTADTLHERRVSKCRQKAFAATFDDVIILTSSDSDKARHDALTRIVNRGKLEDQYAACDRLK